jgi:hypothetical protein
MSNFDRTLHAQCAKLVGEIYHIDRKVLGTWTALQDYTVVDLQTSQKERFVAYMLLRQGANVFMVFRGTQGLKDMFTDIQYKPSTVTTDPCVLQVHSGIYSATGKSIEMMETKLLDLVGSDRISNFIFTGHSLGGIFFLHNNVCHPSPHADSRFFILYKRN